MTGTIRAYDEKVREQAHRDIRLAAEKIAESAGAKAKVSITKMYDTTVNDEALTERMAPVLKRAADGKVAEAPLAGASEDFSFFAKAGARPVRLPRRHPARSGPGQGGAEPQPALLRRRECAGRGRSDSGLSRGELPYRSRESRAAAARAALRAGEPVGLVDRLLPAPHDITLTFLRRWTSGRAGRSPV